MFTPGRALACALLTTATLGLAACGSDSSTDATDKGLLKKLETTKTKPVDPRVASTKTLRDCLQNSGRETRVIQASAMKVPADIQEMVQTSGATIVHLNSRPSPEGGDLKEPATDILVNPAAGATDTAFSERVTTWLDKRAGLDTQDAGTVPSSDIAAPTGPQGFLDGPTIDGYTTLGYALAPNTLLGTLKSCRAMN